MNNISTFLLGNEWYVIWWGSTHLMMTYTTIVHFLLCIAIISASENSLDGSKLSDRLKEISDSTGLAYMQVLSLWVTNSFYWGVRVMVLKTTFNNISTISWRSVLFVRGNRSTRRKQQVTVHSTPVNIAMNGIRTHNSSFYIIGKNKCDIFIAFISCMCSEQWIISCSKQ